MGLRPMPMPVFDCKIVESIDDSKSVKRSVSWERDDLT